MRCGRSGSSLGLLSTCFQPRLLRKRWSALATISVPSSSTTLYAGLTVTHLSSTVVIAYLR